MTGNKDKDRVLKQLEKKEKKERQCLNRTKNANTKIDARFFYASDYKVIHMEWRLTFTRTFYNEMLFFS